MSVSIKLSLAQFSVTKGDPISNLSKIKVLASKAKASGCELICLPEMCTTGFSWAKNREMLNLSKAYTSDITKIAKLESIAICGSFLEKTDCGNAANCFHYIDANGNIVGRYRKLHLFTLLDEHLHIKAGTHCDIFKTAYGLFGAGICYDLRFPELFRRLADQGSQIIFLPSAFPHPRLEHWRTLIRARAIENQCFIVATNQCGIENHSGKEKTCYFGHSMVVNPWGDIEVEADESESLVEVLIDISLVEKVRTKMTAQIDRRTDIFNF